jgi:GTPase SAR1 family protein
MVGDVGAGKTSFLNRYIEDKFVDEDNTAVPAEFVRLIRVFIPMIITKHFLVSSILTSLYALLEREIY